MRFRVSAAAALFLSLGAIELGAQQPPPTPPTAEPKAQQEPRRRRGDRSKLTRQDIDEAGNAVVTARDAIRLLRPHGLGV